MKQTKTTDATNERDESHSLIQDNSESLEEVHLDTFEPVKVTIEEAFEKVGGFGKFQKWAIIVNTLQNVAASIFLYSFAFLEREPTYRCLLD